MFHRHATSPFGYAVLGLVCSFLPWLIYARAVSKTANSAGFLGPLLALACGAISLWLLLKSVSAYRTIANTPTSKIGALAMGLVELSGQAKKSEPLKGPFSQRAAVYYRYSVEELRSSSKRSRWVTILSGSTHDIPFELDDGTGRVVVDPREAEIHAPVTFNETFGGFFGKEVPAALEDFLTSYGSSGQSFFGSKEDVRFTEHAISPDQPLYVIGTARHQSTFVSERKQELTKRLRELKASPEKMGLIDANKDGVVNAQEWDAGVRAVEEQIIQRELQSPATNQPDIVIVKEGGLNVISTEPESKLVRSYQWGALVCFLALLANAAFLALSLGRSQILASWGLTF